LSDELEEVAGYLPRGATVALRHRFAYLLCGVPAVDQREHEVRGFVDRDPIAGHGIQKVGTLE
jgi:hypothetical protein